MTFGEYCVLKFTNVKIAIPHMYCHDEKNGLTIDDKGHTFPGDCFKQNLVEEDDGGFVNGQEKPQT